jgi:hypothetical protein
MGDKTHEGAAAPNFFWMKIFWTSVRGLQRCCFAAKEGDFQTVLAHEIGQKQGNLRKKENNQVAQEQRDQHGQNPLEDDL